MGVTQSGRVLALGASCRRFKLPVPIKKEKIMILSLYSNGINAELYALKSFSFDYEIIPHVEAKGFYEVTPPVDSGALAMIGPSMFHTGPGAGKWMIDYYGPCTTRLDVPITLKVWSYGDPYISLDDLSISTSPCQVAEPSGLFFLGLILILIANRFKNEQQ